jgi:site-specific recombinase XerC
VTLDPTSPGQVRRRHVEAWLADLAARGRSDSTRSVRLKALSRWFDWLADEPGAGVKANPCATVQRPNPKIQPVPIVEDDPGASSRLPVLGQHRRPNSAYGCSACSLSRSL